ncbi:MAG: uridylate kinase [Synergistaceae bacterium]|jgi:acetylglutamate/LysW-gamma-L-alpha-aminoadipate kinase|nr:uridylate kinase [Synergistaceae bacterium]
MSVFTGVVKIGGAEGNRLEPLTRELASRTSAGERWALVHGASGIMDRMCGERGLEIRMITSPSGYRSRFVGEAERAVFEEAAMAYGALISDALAERGVRSERMSPEDSGVTAVRKDVLRENAGGRIRIVRGNYSGTVNGVDASRIKSAMDKGVIPVLPPLGFDRESSLPINIDGDRLAAAAAAGLRAVLVILSNVPGLMKDVNDPASRIAEGSLGNWDALEHYARGNMKRKLVAAREALEKGVSRVYLADGRVDDPIKNAMEGNGTCLVR